MIKQTVLFALERNYDVILEGILYSKRYATLISELIDACELGYVFYMDVSLEQTFERHKKKHNSHEFGEKELRAWYNKSDLLQLDNEVVLPELNTLEDSINTLLEITGL